MSSVGIAPQFTATKGPSRRAPLSWIMRAASSLPVPDSPQMCTGAWLRATRTIISRSCSMAAELPSSRGANSGAVFSSGVVRSLMALPTSFLSTPRSSGFDTKSNAPSLSARTAPLRSSALPTARVGEHQPEHAAAAPARLIEERRSVRLGQLTGQEQPETRAASAAVKRLENALYVLGCHARPAVGDFQERAG